MRNIAYKKFNKLYLVLLLPLVLALVQFNFNAWAETVDTEAPNINITLPTPGDYTNKGIIKGYTEANTSVTITIDPTGTTVTEAVYSDASGLWQVFPNLEDGNHSVYAEAQDNAGNIGRTSSIDFILDTVRPRVAINSISPKNDMTKVDLNPIIKVRLVETSPFDLATLQESITLYEGSNISGTGVSGTTNYDPVTQELTFVPTEPLQVNTKYTAVLSSFMRDEAGNFINPVIWSFTTKGDTNVEDPHGNYGSNVNVCANCHSTHNAKKGKLEGPDPQQIDNYCSACHDGTSAPIPDNWSETKRHDFPVSMDGTPGTNSCASCHNPHLTWTPENPNMFQDYYSYTHTEDPTNPFMEYPTTSEEQLCESCHASTIKIDPTVTYKRYEYNKWDTATGTIADYSLCLRCHDGTNSVDIKTYYSDTTSGHNFTAEDGSPLNGAMACADCHKTHGSSNLKLLETRLGRYNAKEFNTTATEWDAATERQFCTSCHNGATEIYGRKAPLTQTVSAHQPSSTKACHECHGGSPVAAAHAPKRLK